MSGSLNKVILIGNVGKEPEIRSTHDGREVANLVLATNESWTDKNSGERKDKTEWHRITCFNPNLVNVIRKYVKKGAKLYIEGQLQTRKWQDQAGQQKYSTEVVLQGYSSALTMLDKPTGNNAPAEENQQPAATKAEDGNTGFANDYMDDTIPF
jgi:single-strand DNA-binding protein